MSKLFGLVLAVGLVVSATPVFANPPGQTPPVGASSDDDGGAYDDGDYYGGDYAGSSDEGEDAARIDVGGSVRDDERDDDRAVMRDRSDRGGRGGDRGDRMRAMKQKIKARFDVDHDGRLSPQERAAARRAVGRRIAMMNGRQKMKMFRRIIRKFDTNGDGIVGPKEAPPRLIEKLRKLDRNGDGWVTREDFRGRRRGADRPR
jgi:hypothetical protein